MAINLGEKYSKKVQERYAAKSRTDSYAGHDYDFTGVKTIKIYSVDTVPMTDYTRSGTSRFGSLTELGDAVQEMTLAKDRAFTFSIDNGNKGEQFNVKQANSALKREIDEVMTPEIDKYRLNAWATGKGLSEGFEVLEGSAALTKSNILEEIFNAGAAMSDENVPEEGRTLFIKMTDFVKFKLADQVMGADSMAGGIIKNGYKGNIDSMAVVTVPTSHMPSGVNFIIKHRGATVDPVTLKNMRVHKNPMGVDGDVVEGRIIYDSFVLETRAKGLYVSKSA
jgi:hypothetical protein